MGIDPFTALAIGSLALSGVTMFAQQSQAKAAAAAEQAAAERNFALRNEELTRQQVETNRIAMEDRSDIIRRANQELGAIRVASGEVGASQSSFVRMVAELGATEGIDLSRIESNRKNQVASQQASKRSAAVDYSNTVTRARNEYKSAVTNSVLGFVGSGLQIGGSYYRGRAAQQAATNRTG